LYNDSDIGDEGEDFDGNYHTKWNPDAKIFKIHQGWLDNAQDEAERNYVEWVIELDHLTPSADSVLESYIGEFKIDRATAEHLRDKYLGVHRNRW